MDSNFFIREDYTPQTQAVTWEGDARQYWTEQRVAMAALYQYYVYRLARRIYRVRGYKSLADIGCGPGRKITELFAGVCEDITLIDQPTVAPVVAEIVPGAAFVPADLESVEQDLGRTFDVIICADVLEHLMDPTSAMGFIRRHLSPGGTAILSTPERDYLRGPNCDHSPKAEHVREWNRHEFAQFVTHSGFVIDSQVYYPQIKLPEWQYRLSRLASPFYRSKDWSACQTVVCRAGRPR